MGVSFADFQATPAAPPKSKPATFEEFNAAPAPASRPPRQSTTQPAKETTGERVAGAISSAYQGLTLGAGNKITAAVRTSLPEWAGGEPVAPSGSVADTFRNALREQTGVLDQYRERHPIESTGVEIAGSLPLGATKEVAALFTAPKSAGALSRVARAFGGGAGIGAAGGAAEAVRPGATARDVEHGAEIGAAVGGVAAPVVAATGRGLVRQLPHTPRGVVTPKMSEFASRVLGGPDRSPSGQARQMLSDALRTGGVDLEQAARNVRPDLPTTVMEQGSEIVPSLVRSARNVPATTAKQTTDRFLAERAAGAGERITKAIEEATGRRATDTFLPLEELVTKRALAAKPLYEQAHAYGEIQDPETIAEIQRLLHEDVFQRAWNRGQTLARIEGSAPREAPPRGMSRESFRAIQERGPDVFVPNVEGQTARPTVRQIDRWKKGLDAVIDAGYGSTNALSKDEAHKVRQALNNVLARVDEEVPAYKAARATYRGDSEMLQAAKEGTQHWVKSRDGQTLTADVLAREQAARSPAEREIYRTQGINELAARIKQLSTNKEIPEAGSAPNVLQRVMGTADAEERLALLFPNEQQYQQFVARVEDEALYPKTNAFLRQQSSTAKQLAEGQMTAGMLRDAALGSIPGHYGGGARRRLLHATLQKALGNVKVPRAVADEIGQQATKTGQDLVDLLNAMRVDQPARDAARARVRAVLTPAAVAATGGRGKPFSIRSPEP